MDTQRVVTQEFARNPNPEIRIACTVCKKDYPLEDTLKERDMPPPYETVVEGYLACPFCGDEKHNYYLTEYLRFRQVELKKAIEKWHATKSIVDWRIYAKKQKSFQAIYEEAQKKYVEMFKGISK